MSYFNIRERESECVYLNGECANANASANVKNVYKKDYQRMI